MKYPHPGRLSHGSLQPWTIILSFGIAAAVGVGFGFYPARKAAMLNPIDARATSERRFELNELMYYCPTLSNHAPIHSSFQVGE